MNNSPTSHKKSTKNSLHKWIPAFGFAVAIHIFFILLFLYANKTKQQPTNAQPDHTPAPSVMTTELTNHDTSKNKPEVSTNDATTTINNPDSTTIKQQPTTQTGNNNTTSTHTATQEVETTKNRSENHMVETNQTLKNPNKDTTTNANNKSTNQTTTTNQENKETANQTPALNLEGEDNQQIMEEHIQAIASKNTGNAMLIEGIDTPSKEKINTVKDQLSDTNQQLDQLDKQNNLAKETATQLHEQTSEKINAIIKYNQQSIEQNNQQKKLAFEQDTDKPK